MPHTSSLRLVGLWLAVGTLGGCSGDFSSLREPAPVGGPALMRRLTESQYRATVTDIFGADVKIAARFEPGLREEGLIAVGTSQSGMSPFGIEQYHAAALSISGDVMSEARREKFVSCKPPQDTKAFNADCARRFFERWGPMLWRRPVSDQDTRRFVDLARSGTERLGDFYAGLQLALAGTLVSPEFLLRIETTEPDPRHSDRVRLDAWSKATRLSYFLTNSAPDQELLRAAGAGELDDRHSLERQVDRLIASPHFERALRVFFSDMLQFDKFEELAKDPVIYPAFNSTVAADAQEQTLRTITALLITQHGDYRDLFTTREAYLTRALGTVYRIPVPTRNGWETQEFPEDSHRVGIQSQIAFLALYSHPGRSSPTLRGKALREIFLCEEVPDPPPKVNFAGFQDSNAHMPTARDRLIAHRTQPSCAGCHKVMDPPGLTLENFDGGGTYRSEENGARIDPGGDLDGFQIKTPEGLAQALHDHPETPRCLVERMYRFGVGRDTSMQERPYMDYLIASFKESGYRVPDLMRTIALSDNFYTISAPGSLDREFEQVASQTVNGGRS
jgi:Protein of unknown function (DUF1592)/Protein of unknown function (DUF1588)/Protein of unknown function (DUF1595)/Protein of unknown function (DUF1585)/Protein of unknown function (DUF1587)